MSTSVALFDKMLSFYSFPQEIQHMILNELAQSSDLASFACIDKQWQAFFEARLFRHLIISQDDIKDFDITVHGVRRGYVKHIWLRILLPTQPYVWRKEQEDEYVLWEADRIFTMSIFDLWGILAEWDTSETAGFTFELSVHSPSDRGKYVRDDFFKRDVELYQKYLETGSTNGYKSSGDVYAPYLKAYRGLGGKFGTQMWARTVTDLFGWKPLECDIHDAEDEPPELPIVSVVARFLVRRQQFREIFPASLGKMLSSLAGLEEVSCERWRCLDAKDETSWCQSAKSAFVLDLPVSVKTLSLYGDTASIFQEWSPKEVNSISLAEHLRNYGRHLENISVSFLIDAQDFFQPFSYPYSECTTVWKNLETLSLTCRTLRSSSTSHINKLLCAAARAANKMPKLRLLELWDGAEGKASVFRYCIVHKVAEILWLSTITPKIGQQVVNTWTSVAVAQGQSDVRVSTQALDSEEILSAGTVLRYLYLREQILHPVSGYRIAWEQEKQS
ncbi:hypothetical protein ACHAPT_004673 [Fusarium lateritium]